MVDRRLLAVVAAAVLALVGCGAPVTAPGVLPTTSPLSPEAGSSVAAVSPALPEAAARPSASAAVTPPPYRVLAAAAYAEARWAPDGGHVAVWTTDESRAGGHTLWWLFDRAGRVVESVEGPVDGFAWTGPQTYALRRLAAGGAASYVTRRLGSSAETPTSAVPIAAVVEVPCILADNFGTYSVAVAGRSVERDGVPAACSSDNRLVAVADPAMMGRGLVPPLRIVRVDTGKIVRRLPDAIWPAFETVAFSADASHLAVGNAIVNIATGETVSLPIVHPHADVWLPDGRLAVIDELDSRIRAFDVSGRESASALPLARGLSVSPAGVIAVVGADGPVTFVGGGRSTMLEPPGPAQRLFWSPDGSAIVLTCDIGNDEQQAILVETP